MNGRKVEDGGILYDENETDEDDELQESPATGSSAPAVATPGIDWNEGGDLPEGVTGADLIQHFVNRLPNSPGVYRMFNADGDVLYVGKARSLKKRVSNYAQGRVHSNRLTQMVRQTANMVLVSSV